MVLISIAVDTFGYDRDEITKMVHNDEYQLSYEEGMSPMETIQEDERTGI